MLEKKKKNGDDVNMIFIWHDYDSTTFSDGILSFLIKSLDIIMRACTENDSFFLAACLLSGFGFFFGLFFDSL